MHAARITVRAQLLGRIQALEEEATRLAEQVEVGTDSEALPEEEEEDGVVREILEHLEGGHALMGAIGALRQELDRLRAATIHSL